MPREGKGCLVTYRLIGQCHKLRIVRYIIVSFQTEYDRSCGPRYIYSLIPRSVHSFHTLMFATRKRKGEAPLSNDPDTKRVRHWERMQTGFDAAKLKIQRNHRVRKKRGLDALHATDKYKSMTSAEREQADTTVIMDCETRRNTDLAAAARQWKHLNQSSDDKSNDNSNDDANDDNDSGDGRDDDNANDLDSESPDDNEADMSDPEFEVNESAAAQEGVPYELDEDGKVKLDEETTAGLRHILERARQRNALFIRRVMELGGQHSENEINWESEDSEASADETNEKKNE